MNKNKNRLAYFAAILLFSIIPAFFVWGNALLPILSVSFSLVFLIDAIIYGPNKKITPVLVYTFFVLTWYVIVSEVSIYGAIMILTPVLLLLPTSSFHNKVFEAFLRVFSILMGISILSYILVIILGVNLPHLEIPPLNQSKTESYYLFPFFVTRDGVFTPYLIRFMGFFDEAGVVGTICAILLLTERFDLKKWENVVVLIAGVLSMSFFFFLVCFVFLILKVPFKLKIVVVLIGITLFFVLRENEILYDVFFSRFTINDGQLVGMNREHGYFSDYFEKFRHTSAYWTGLGHGTGELLNEGGSSYKQVIVDYGVIFFVLYLGCFYLNALSISKRPSMLLFFSILLLGTMYQRPFVGIGSIALFYLMMAIPYRIVEKY